MPSAVQFSLPLFTAGEPALERAMVEVVTDHGRARVKPVGLTGWVKFPRRLREPGALYVVEKLSPRPGGAWTASGRIRRVA
jgi:hypothetical protein